MEPGAGDLAPAPNPSRPTAPWSPAPFGLDIALGDVPWELPDAAKPRRWIYVTDEMVLVRFPGGRRLLIEGGQRVTLHWPLDGDDADDHNWAIDSWAVPLAMLQRGLLPLHASTVRIGDAGLALAGRSGAGKSTTAVGLRSRGHELVVDETTLLEVTGSGILIHPYPRRIHLTEPAARRLGVPLAGTQPVALSRDKLALTPAPRSLEPVPLTQVVTLQAVEPPALEGPTVRVESMTGAFAMATLSVHAERLGIAPLVLGRERYLALLGDIAERTSVVAIHRPANEWSLEDVMNAIEELAGTQQETQGINTGFFVS